MIMEGMFLQLALTVSFCTHDGTPYSPLLPQPTRASGWSRRTLGGAGTSPAVAWCGPLCTS